jgi:hypothetical protein
MAPTHPVPENNPDTVQDATQDAFAQACLQRYVTLLLRWEALTRRQQAYEQELAKLAATGEQLRPEWDALAADYRASLAELQALPLPLDTVIRRVWDLFKAQLRAVYDKVVEEHGTPYQGSAFFALRDAIQALAEPLALPPLLTNEASHTGGGAPA